MVPVNTVRVEAMMVKILEKLVNLTVKNIYIDKMYIDCIPNEDHSKIKISEYLQQTHKGNVGKFSNQGKVALRT